MGRSILNLSGSELAQQLSQRAKEDTKGLVGDGYQAIRIDRSLAGRLEKERQSVPNGVKVRPHKDAGGVEAGRRLLRDLHTIDRSRWSKKNVSAAHSFEPRYVDEDGSIMLQFVPHDESWWADLESNIRDQYPGAITDVTDSEVVDLSAGRWATVVDLRLDRYPLHLIRNVDLEGFDRNPYGSILSEMSSAADRTNSNVDITCQTIFRPEVKPWKTGVDVEPGHTVRDIIYKLEQPNIEYRRHPYFPWKKQKMKTDPSPKERKAAQVMGDIDGEEAWNLNVRVVVSADDPETVELAAQKVAQKFENYYESSTEQKFTPHPLRGHAVRKGLVRAVSRQWVDQQMVFTEAEVAGLVNCMDDQIHTNKFNWALANPGEGLPPGMPTYDFEAAGVAGESDAVKFLTMIENPEYGDDALWLGFDQVTGEPVGLWSQFLNAHTQGTGRTRMGKTTVYTNVFSQNVRKGEGGIVVTHGKPGEDDGELDDDEEFMAEIPEWMGPEDYVVIDTGDDFEKMVRFNLLEIPDHLEPGTAEHTSYMYSLCDDFCAAIAQAGGDSEGLYPLMKGLTRTAVRGMSLSGHTATPMDLFAACSSSENMGVLLEWMKEDRIKYVQKTVERFKEKSDEDFEPVARRMDEILHNSTLRKLLSAREPTVSMQEIVDDGKWIFLRIDPALGDTETKFLTSPLIRRGAHAKKMSPNSDPFHVIWDEADKSASIHSNLAKLLSIMGGYKMYFHLIYQAPSNQLPPQLWDATSTQIDSTFSFRTASDDANAIAKLHSNEIESSDLTHLPRYSFYASLDTESGEPAPSVLVNGAPPVREMRVEHEDIDPLSKADIVEMKQQSLDIHGEVPESDEERMALSEFYETPPEFDEEGNIIEEGEIADGEDGSMDATPQPVSCAKTLQAIYDTAYFEHGDGHHRIPLEDVTDRIENYLESVDATFVPETPSQYTAFLGYIPTTRLEREDEDGTYYVRCTPEGKMRFTTPADLEELLNGADDDETEQDGEVSENTGGPEHAAIMRDAYDHFLELFFRMDIHQQGGEEMPDATATPIHDELVQARTNDDLDEVAIADLIAAFKDNHPLADRLSNARPIAIEAEHWTGKSAPAQTYINIAKALNQGLRCLLLARPKTATKLYEDLTDPSGLMYSYGPVDGAMRLYNKNRDLRVGSGDEQVYRSAEASQSVWLRMDDGTYQLRDTDGNKLATFERAEQIVMDTDKYLTEDEVEDFDEVTTVKAPFVPELEFDECIDGVRPAMNDVDVAEVRSADKPLRIVDGPDEEDRIPFADLPATQSPSSSRSSSSGSGNENSSLSLADL